MSAAGQCHMVLAACSDLVAHCNTFARGLKRTVLRRKRIVYLALVPEKPAHLFASADMSSSRHARKRMNITARINSAYKRQQDTELRRACTSATHASDINQSYHLTRPLVTAQPAHAQRLRTRAYIARCLWFTSSQSRAACCAQIFKWFAFRCLGSSSPSTWIQLP